MGGRGKTPLVMMLARHLVALGERPAILSRGYGRRVREDGAVIVSDGTHVIADLDRGGDEPLMLARAVPGAAVVVCEQRAIAAALARRVLGATVNVLDDGFQHRSLRRDIDVVAIAPEDLRDRRVPFGRLRQPPSALRDADVIVVDGRREDADLRHLSCPVFSMTRVVGNPVAIETNRPPVDLGARRTAPVIAVAGIAHPERFRTALVSAGWTVAQLIPFPDHHRFRLADLNRIAEAVRETGASGVLTTEKDAVRLRPLRPLPVPFAAVPLTIALDPPGQFEDWIVMRLRELRA